MPKIQQMPQCLNYDSNNLRQVPIDGLERYFVNKLGQVFVWTEKGFQEVKQQLIHTYYRVPLNLPNGKTKTIQTGRLVLMAFQPRKDMHKLQCNHIDLDKGNNQLENLEWVTNEENRLHYLANSTHEQRSAKCSKPRKGKCSHEKSNS